MSTDKIHVDVAIVGGRVAGASLARLLACAGLRVLVIDRATFPSDTTSTAAIGGAGGLLLRRWGLLDALLATGVPQSRVAGITVGTVELAVPMPPNRPAFMAPRRTVLDAMIVEAARDSGVTVLEESSLRGLRWHDRRVVGLHASRVGGRDIEVTAALVVGADGIGSRVARAVAAETYDRAPSRISGMYAFIAGEGIANNELGFGGGHATLAFPTHDDLVCVAAVVPDDQFPALVAGGDDAFDAVVRTACPRVAEAAPAARRASRFYAFRARDNQRVMPYGPGWALVGDAGYYRDPITGQGITDAFVSAQLLADAVIAGLGGVGPIDESLERYRSRRDELSRDMYAVTCALSRYEWSDDSLGKAILEYGNASAAIAAAVEDGLRLDEVVLAS